MSLLASMTDIHLGLVSLLLRISTEEYHYSILFFNQLINKNLYTTNYMFPIVGKIMGKNVSERKKGAGSSIESSLIYS